ncbi:ATP-binding protein [Caviibacterium pharyngocola]|uniref:Serine/threonine protein phosphatase n=1 Tax=Caviibacterium pharyngocola TaxID=28159 RepID=A0A2M8RX23_9PAST|nr:ATP-binding protein [Caviibacterium pharyngocola]PJG83439.1 serine/threonine protein phosphatase [Caviibacterium pharyngocola]
MCTEYQLNPPTVSLYAEQMMLKMLFEHNLFQSFIRNNNWRDDDVANALGLPMELENNDNLKPIARSLLTERFQTIKSAVEIPEKLQIAYENIDKLTAFLDLNNVEETFFRFLVHFHCEREINALARFFSRMDLPRIATILAELLEVKKSEMMRVFSKNRKLTCYGLLGRGYSPNDVDDYIQWGETLDFDEFISQPLTKVMLLSRCTTTAKSPTLSLSHFDHIQDMREMALNYLRKTTGNGKQGVNILLYGQPGTGKTEFATLLGQALNLETYLMAHMDKEGDVLSGKTRLENCQLAQKLLAGGKNLIIFDEVEDVFGGSLLERSVAQEHKAWVNQFLENNDVPMIWISNDVNCMDNAYLRRYDLVIEMPDLPLKNKENLIKSLAGDKLSEAYVQHLAQVKGLTPAIVHRGLNVVTEILPEHSEQDFAEQVIKVFNQTLTAQGYQKIAPLSDNKQADYSLDYVSCKSNIYKISEGLKRTKRGRICCYGVPGTGKTAWAKWLAQELEMKPLVVQGSDLLDMYVGGTEQNIANAFAQAKENNQLLILDEVDSFLFTRQGAQRSWERSQVNEMLTQIEKFDGLMVVSTNLLDELDPASLRRFDLKLQFDYLTESQRLALAKAQCEKLGFALNAPTQAKIARLYHLTPGDFATVARRHRFAEFDNAEEWADALEEECLLKKAENKRTIGFV